jgi:hypothetical protein
MIYRNVRAGTCLYAPVYGVDALNGAAGVATIS